MHTKFVSLWLQCLNAVLFYMSINLSMQPNLYLCFEISDKVSLCSFVWLWTCYVAESGLEHVAILPPQPLKCCKKKQVLCHLAGFYPTLSQQHQSWLTMTTPTFEILEYFKYSAVRSRYAVSIHPLRNSERLKKFKHHLVSLLRFNIMTLEEYSFLGTNYLRYFL